MVDYDKARDCEHGRQIGKCGDCEYQDLLGELSDLRAERDALKQTLHDELDENLRLREMGKAQEDEGMTAFLERVIAERDALRKALMRVKTEAVSLADAQVIALEALKGDKP